MTTPQQVFKLYKSIIDDVIWNVREAFNDEGVDEQVLQDLKQIWEAKLIQTKAVDPNAPATSSSSSSQKNNGSQSRSQRHQQAKSAPEPKPVPVSVSSNIQMPLQQAQYQGNLSNPAAAATLAVQQQLVQIARLPSGATISLPQQAGGSNQGQTFAGYSVQGQGNVVQVPLVLQQVGQDGQPYTQHIMATIPQGMVDGSTAAAKPDTQRRGQNISQVDGANDTSDEEDDDSDDDDDDDRDDDDDGDDNDNDEPRNAVEEEPLNSDDDVSDEDPAEIFEADNVVVCQYDKISRTRNKWKFQLKQGIMNLKGTDHIFYKASGDADW